MKFFESSPRWLQQFPEHIFLTSFIGKGFLLGVLATITKTNTFTIQKALSVPRNEERSTNTNTFTIQTAIQTPLSVPRNEEGAPKTNTFTIQTTMQIALSVPRDKERSTKNKYFHNSESVVRTKE